MTRDEVKKLFYMLMAVYPNFHSRDDDDTLRMAIDAWAVALSDFPAEFINSGMKTMLQRQKFPAVPADVIEAAKDNALDWLLACEYVRMGVDASDMWVMLKDKPVPYSQFEQERKALGPSPKLRIAE